MKIGASLGITLCTDPDAHNFLKLGVEVQDIDPEGDVEAQANSALVANLKVIKILDSGLQEVVQEILVDSELSGTSVKEQLDKHSQEIQNIQRVLGPTVRKIKELAAE
jgi:hypothetical protein